MVDISAPAYAPTHLPITPGATPLAPDSTSAASLSGGMAGSGFKDLLDMVNPLQQLPVVSSVYRAVTGDTISIASSVVGGALFGGPIGFAAAAVNAMVKGATGQDIGGHVLAGLEGTAAASAPGTLMPVTQEAATGQPGPASPPTSSLSQLSGTNAGIPFIPDLKDGSDQEAERHAKLLGYGAYAAQQKAADQI